MRSAIGSPDLRTGALSWLNAGHPLPLLVRDGSHGVELSCRPSLPMGLGGAGGGVAVERLQAGDRALFDTDGVTDGVTETRSSDGERFGLPRLIDFLVRATHEHSSPVETLRTLSATISAYSNTVVSDDATLVMLEYHGT